MNERIFHYSQLLMLLTSPRAPGVRPRVRAVHAGQTGQGGQQSRAQAPGHSVSSPQRRLLGQVIDKRNPEHTNGAYFLTTSSLLSHLSSLLWMLGSVLCCGVPIIL